VVKTLVRDGAPGVVALVRDGDRVKTFSGGLADFKPHRAMQAALRFRVGSLSKSMVATLVLELVAQRRLRLSDTVARWLPGLTTAAAKITVRELLEQRSGLPEYIYSPQLFPSYFSGERPLSYVWTPSQLIRLALRHPLDFPPGRRFEYSNTNYIVLGLLLERVTHMQIARYAEQTLFKPLNMRSTSFAFGRITGAHAHGYAPFGPPFPAASPGMGDVESLNGSSYWAAGALVSTASDLDRFFRALFTLRILPRRLVRLMQDALVAQPGYRYGLGLEETRYGCGPAWGHSGDVPGYTAIVRASRPARRLVVLLVNRDFLPHALAAEVQEATAALYCGPISRRGGT
jgi:D-alanyl-D-alanine carboxypeptidase